MFLQLSSFLIIAISIFASSALAANPSAETCSSFLELSLEKRMEKHLQVEQLNFDRFSYKTAELVLTLKVDSLNIAVDVIQTLNRYSLIHNSVDLGKIISTFLSENQSFLEKNLTDKYLVESLIQLHQLLEVKDLSSGKLNPFDSIFSLRKLLTTAFILAQQQGPHSALFEQKKIMNDLYEVFFSNIHFTENHDTLRSIVDQIDRSAFEYSLTTQTDEQFNDLLDAFRKSFDKSFLNTENLSNPPKRYEATVNSFKELKKLLTSVDFSKLSTKLSEAYIEDILNNPTQDDNTYFKNLSKITYIYSHFHIAKANPALTKRIIKIFKNSPYIKEFKRKYQPSFFRFL